MKTARHEQEQFDTTTSSPTGDVVPSDIVASGSDIIDTSLPIPPKGQSVPSSSCEGNVWLSYVPHERIKDGSDSFTR
jgi:hypothetical protein